MNLGNPNPSLVRKPQATQEIATVKHTASPFTASEKDFGLKKKKKVGSEEGFGKAWLFSTETRVRDARWRRM